MAKCLEDESMIELLPDFPDNVVFFRGRPVRAGYLIELKPVGDADEHLQRRMGAGELGGIRSPRAALAVGGGSNVRIGGFYRRDLKRA